MTAEITAFHEAGHVYAAIFVGAKVRSVTIDPDNDDGPNRSGIPLSSGIVAAFRGRS